ncbi:MAG: hypothetical protein AMXMBFR64_47220 [Myxococcales bacterium]
MHLTVIVLTALLGALLAPPPPVTTWLDAPTRAGSTSGAAPEAIDDSVLLAARRVLTDPGDLPRLQVKVGKKTTDLPLQRTHVSMEVSGFTARVEVTQTWRNPLDKPIEAVYVFPLPENSAVDDMKIRVGDRLIEAEIQRRDDARRTYEDAKRDGHTAALLEQERPNVFTQSIANMEPGKDIEVVIRYVQDLTWDAGEVEVVFPMVVGPRFIPGAKGGKQGTGWSRDTDAVPDASRVTPPIVGAGFRSGNDISIEVVIAPGLPVADLEVPTHDVELAEVDGAMIVQLAPHERLPNRDFVLRFRTDAPTPTAAVYAHRVKRGGFFQLIVQPPATTEVLAPREVIFVIDVSGSMSGLPLAMAKDAARQAISRLRPVDTFNVVTFAGQTGRVFEASRPANAGNVRLGLGFVDAAMAGGGTYLATAVTDALSAKKADVERGRDRVVVFLTDGYVGNEAQILAQIEGLVRGFKARGLTARAFGFGTGSSVNRMLMDGIGKAGNGATVYLTSREDPSRAVAALYRMIDRPVLSGISIDWGGLAVADVEPAALPDLVASRPLVIHGRYLEPGAATVTLHATSQGTPISLPIQVDLAASEERNGSLETLWARARVESLDRLLWGGHDAGVVEQITALGLDYRLVTAYTSFVAVDRSKRVGDGTTRTITQPGDAPEGVNLSTAMPVAGVFTMKAAEGAALMGHGSGGMGFRGTGAGGGGAVGYGRIVGMGKGGGRVAKAPAVKVASAVVSGSADRETVQRQIRRHTGAIRAVYERSLQSNPALKGKIVVRITIDKDGSVSEVRVESDTLGDEETTKGLVAVIKKIVFPKQGGIVVVTYPFVFSPE